MDRHQIDKRKTMWKTIAIIFIIFFSLSAFSTSIYMYENSILIDENTECRIIVDDWVAYAEDWVAYAKELQDNNIFALNRCKQYFYTYNYNDYSLIDIDNLCKDIIIGNL